MTTIHHVVIGGAVSAIGEYAFAECKNFDDITCYAVDVPTITSTTFSNIGNKKFIYLCVPEGRQRAYLRDYYWGQFDVQIKNAESVEDPVNDVTVNPTDNAAEITWPTVNQAETYELAIIKDDETVCKLIFNALGQLTGIAFSPGRDASHVQKAQTEGFRFTVTGLNSGTIYGYSIAAKDIDENALDTKTGTFTTTNKVATDIDNISIDSPDTATRKILLNGQIFILRGDKIYTVQGQEVR